MRFIQFDHFSFPVRDIGLSVAFYRDMFGLEVTRTNGDPPRVVWLGHGGSDLIHLTEVRDETFESLKKRHLALSVADFDGFVAGLVARSFTFFDWAGAEGGITTHGLGFRQVYFPDPDGHWLEVNDRWSSEAGA